MNFGKYSVNLEPDKDFIYVASDCAEFNYYYHTQGKIFAD